MPQVAPKNGSNQVRLQCALRLQAQSSRANTWWSERKASLRTLDHRPTTPVVSYSVPHVYIVMMVVCVDVPGMMLLMSRGQPEL